MTHCIARPILTRMAADKPTTAVELEFRRLEQRIGELLELCERLRDENRLLRIEQEALRAEKATLARKNREVHQRVEAMIERLRGMERSV